jgi:hypothetical protein
LRPAPLSEQDVARLIAEHGIRGADPEFVSVCHRVGGGNPFLVVELLAALEAEGAHGTAADAARIAGIAPESIVRWVLARLAALGEDARRLAFAFSVLGGGVALSDAAVLGGLESAAAVAAADALIGAQIFTRARPREFVHPLVQAAVYDGLSPARRGEAHGRAAHLIEERGAPLARVAAHLLAADPGRDGWVVEMLRAAAREADARGAPGSAVRYLRRALEEASQRARAELLLELGEAQLRAGVSGATKHIREALDLSTDRRRRAEICLALVLKTPPNFSEHRCRWHANVLKRKQRRIRRMHPELCQFPLADHTRGIHRNQKQPKTTVV